MAGNSRRCDFTDAPINQPDRWHSERLNARLTGAAEQKLREIVEAARNGSLNVSKLLAIAIWLTEKSEE